MTDVETVARAIMIAKGGACDVTDWAEREWNPAVAEVWDAATAALAAATPLIEARVAAALVEWLRSRGECQSADDEIAAWLQLQTGNPQ